MYIHTRVHDGATQRSTLEPCNYIGFNKALIDSHVHVHSYACRETQNQAKLFGAFERQKRSSNILSCAIYTHAHAQASL